MKNHRSDIIFFFLIAIVLYAAYRVRNVLMIIYLGILFAVVLAPAIDAVRRIRIGKYRPGRGVAIVVLLVGLLGAITLFFVFALPPIFDDLQALYQNWPSKMASITEKARSLPFLSSIDMSRLQAWAAGLMGGALGVLQGLAGGVFGIFTWIIVTAYFILDGERAYHWALSMFPREKRERLDRTLIKAEKRMRNWLVGQLALMAILGVYTLIVFGTLQLKYFYALAAFCGLANIVPIVGPVVSVSLAAIVALVDAPWKVLAVVGAYVAYQQLETAFLTPKIMKASVDLPALAVIIALSLGGALAGIIGALVAVPTAALCAVLIDEYLVHKDAAKS